MNEKLVIEGLIVVDEFGRAHLEHELEDIEKALARFDGKRVRHTIEEIP